MSVLLNAVKSSGQGMGMADPSSLLAQTIMMKKLANQSKSNLKLGSKSCLGINEVKDVASGIAQGDFKKATLNAATLALQVVPIAGLAASSTKLGAAQLTASSKMCALLAGSHVLNSQIQNKDYGTVNLSSTTQINNNELLYQQEDGAEADYGEEVDGGDMPPINIDSTRGEETQQQKEDEIQNVVQSSIGKKKKKKKKRSKKRAGMRRRKLRKDEDLDEEEAVPEAQVQRIETPIMQNDDQYVVAPDHRLFPLCVVWYPWNCWTKLIFPWVGHIGVGDLGGMIHDFNRSNYISVNEFMIGQTHKYTILDMNGYTQEQYSDALDKTNDKFRQLRHLSFWNNSHVYTADLLNNLKYQGKENWNVLTVWWLTWYKAKYCSWKHVYYTYKVWIWLVAFWAVMTLFEYYQNNQMQAEGGQF